MLRTRPPHPLGLLCALVLAVAAASGCTDTPEPAAATPGGATAATATSSAPTAPPGAAGSGAQSGDFVTAIQRVAASVKPSVVQITTEQVQQDPFGQGGASPAGVGSGVFFDDQGHILTNNHVIEGASSIRVSLVDGRSFPGTLVGGDPQTDLAVIRVQAQDLPRAPLGDSERLQVGEWVVAIGHALGLSGGPTVTTGVVSALGRTVQEPGDGPGGGGGPFLFDVIQTDASINPGNSGGPLVNLDGEVVGLNTLGAGRAGPDGPQAQGIGFAISVNNARRIAAELIQNGRVAHPYLGIRYVALTPAVAAQLGIEGAPGGALLGEVITGSPAARAGLRAEDVITKVDGETLRGESALAAAVDGHRPGDTITVTVLRDGQTTDLRVTLAETPGD